MLEILCFDICAVVILAILIFGLGFNKTVNDKPSKKLQLLIYITAAAAFLDIAANYYNGTEQYETAFYLLEGLYHVMRNVAYYVYASYIIAITGTWYKRKKSVLKYTRFLPIAVVCLIAITAEPYRIVYYYGEGYARTRGPLFPLLYFCGAIYIVYSLFFIIKNISLIGRRKAVSLGSCAIFSFVASLIQYRNPHLVVDIFGFTLSLLFIVLFVDNPRDKIDSASSLLRYQAYVNDLKTAFFTSKPIDIIHINVVNSGVIEGMLSYTNYTEFVREISNRLSLIDTVGRYEASLYYLKNGKFRAVLSGNDYKRTFEAAGKISTALKSEVIVNDMGFSLDVTLCITQCPQDFTIMDDLLTFGKVAARYEKPGKIVFTKDILKAEDYGITSNVDKLIERGILYDRFEVYYQPIYDVAAGRLTRAEALLRLKGEDGTIIEPDAFIEGAEQNGAIIELGKIVFRDVCAFIKSEAFNKTDIERISINLSVLQCLQKDMADQIIDMLSQYDIPTDRIALEVRESLATDNQPIFKENIQKLSEAGFSLALDDYGTGYSNIATLSTIQIDTIKFDKSFVNTGANKRLKDILENSIDMIKSLNKRIVVEGVETEASAEYFKEYGCDYIQGFYYAKPMPKDKLKKFYEDIHSSESGDIDAL